MEKDYCNFSDLEPMEKIMYYNSLYMFLSQLNINTPGFAKKYNEMFNSDLTLKAGYEIAICEVDYSIVGVLITVDADESCEPYVLDGYKGIGIEEQLSDMMQRAYARLHQVRKALLKQPKSHRGSASRCLLLSIFFKISHTKQNTKKKSKKKGAKKIYEQ